MLLGAVLEVERLSRRAREAAASDLAHYDALVTARQVLEHHQREAAGIRERAEQLAASAFGQQARAVAASTLAEARQLEQTLGDLVEQRTAEAAAFQAEPPGRRGAGRGAPSAGSRGAPARARGGARPTAGRSAPGRRAGPAPGRAGRGSGVPPPTQSRVPEPRRSSIGALRTRLHQRAQAARDAAARAALEQAAEHQGRGDLEAAVTVLEQLEVRGLSPEVGEDVFGAWSQACSRLAQSACFDQGTPGSPHQALVRFAPAKGRGLILMRDPAVPHGLVVFSALGMGPGYPRDKVVSDRPDRRAGPWLPARGTAGRGRRRGGQSYASWQSYVTPPAGGGVERH